MPEYTDWNRELKFISQEFDGHTSPSVATLDKARKAAKQHARAQRTVRNTIMGVWARTLLVTALAGGLYFWPYSRACGVGLFGFMGAALLIGAGAVWIVTLSWNQRLARAHAAGLLLVLTSLVLLGTEILPRVGYARTDPVHPPRWVCQ
jgi:hypothetical protein